MALTRTLEPMAGGRYACSFHPGRYKFDRPMQAEAFGWFSRWL